MTATITILNLGTDVGPFNLYSDVDGYVSAFATGVTRAQLLAGYPVTLPDGTQYVRAASVGICENFLIIPIDTLLCYRHLVAVSTYDFYDFIFKENQTYVYGSFDEYENGDEILPAIQLTLLNGDRSLDESFDVSVGPNNFSYIGTTILEQSDGKILLSGAFTSYGATPANFIIRLNTDGSVDNTFVYGSGFSHYTLGMAFDSSENIIVLGRFSTYNGSPVINRIIRLLPNGTRDVTLVTGTGFNNTTVDILVNPDDSMIITGYFNTYNTVNTGLGGICKLSSTGVFDAAFKANTGTGFSPYLPNNPHRFARIPGETGFYVAGYFTSYNGTPANHIIKLNSNGTIDTSFVYGSGFNGNVWRIEVIWGNKLLISGGFSTYNGSDSLDDIILNADGSIFWSNPTNPYYHEPFPIGNILYSAQYGECYEPIYYFEETTTTTTSSSTTSTSTTTTTSTTTAIPPTTTLAPGTVAVYTIQRCTSGDTFYANKVNGCIFGSSAPLSSTWTVGQYVQFVIGTSCPGGATFCGVVTSTTNFAVPTALISTNSKPGNCFDILCFE